MAVTVQLLDLDRKNKKDHQGNDTFSIAQHQHVIIVNNVPYEHARTQANGTLEYVPYDRRQG